VARIFKAAGCCLKYVVLVSAAQLVWIRHSVRGHGTMLCNSHKGPAYCHIKAFKIHSEQYKGGNRIRQLNDNKLASYLIRFWSLMKTRSVLINILSRV